MSLNYPINQLLVNAKINQHGSAHAGDEYVRVVAYGRWFRVKILPYFNETKVLMRLIHSDDTHVAELMTWFPEETALKIWGGPDMRHPTTNESFLEDINFDKISSYILVNHLEQMVAFGQFYNRLERCHLCRLAVAPRLRGQGIGTKFITDLRSTGCKKLLVKNCSLFVAEDNRSACKLYLSLGFKIAKYPGGIPLEGCLYMVT